MKTGSFVVRLVFAMSIWAYFSPAFGVIPIRYWVCTGFNWDDYHKFYWDMAATRSEAYAKAKRRCDRAKIFCDMVCEYQNP